MRAAAGSTRLFIRALAGTLAGTVAVTLLLALAAPAAAKSGTSQRNLRILSFNVEHMMSPARFGEWRSFCEPLGWQEPGRDGQRDGQRARPRQVRPEELTYCNALDGTDGRGRRVFAPARDDRGWQQKLSDLVGLVREADGDVVLLQEVSDIEAAGLILGPRYRVASTRELWPGHVIAQNLAIGWRTDLAAGSPQVELVESISQAGDDGRRTRPGLALALDLGGGRRLAILNLHLKAGCRQGRLNEVPSRKPDRVFRRKADCAVFQEQVPALERWADDRLRQGFGVVIAGDFNRDLLREIRDRMPARSDGSDPALPAPSSRIASLVAEISDEDPPAAWFALIRTGRYGKLADCHRNIDAFLVSRNVQQWLATPFRQLSATVIPFADPVTLDRVRPSDHCPHLLELPLRRVN